MNQQCSKTIYEGRGFSYPCRKKAIVETNGKSYCTIHDPEYIKAKRVKWDAEFDKERAEKKARWELEEARGKATEGLTLHELQQITPDKIRTLIPKEKK